MKTTLLILAAILAILAPFGAIFATFLCEGEIDYFQFISGIVAIIGSLCSLILIVEIQKTVK